ncbi:unnamed protein product [Phytomonas sp. EM1]|nr:unnamed protein product [Phytomonas sp. EM1]|eukprot:CCW60886.1 unnamed protein product [Phytomonas sp. isolate EM1]
MCTRQEQIRGGVGYSTELAGRDRFKFFRHPIEAERVEFPGEGPEGGDIHHSMNPRGAPSIHWYNIPNQFSSTSPSAPTAHLDLHLTGGTTHGYRSTHTGRRLRSAKMNLPPQHFQTGGSRNGACKRRARPYHLPTLNSATSGARGSFNNAVQGYTQADIEAAASSSREVAVQTMYRENDTQTDPYSPDYYIPDDAPKDPEILELKELTWQNKGLPAGQEEVELILRLRRRREVERSLQTSSKDPAVIEENHKKLRELEEIEWKEHEERVEKLNGRRLERMKTLLLDKESTREAINEDRLAHIKDTYMSALREKLSSLYSRRMADSHQIHTQRCRRRNLLSGSDAGTFGGRGGRGMSTLRSSVPDGRETALSLPTGGGGEGAPEAGARQTRVLAYDVRPTLLSVAEGVEVVDRTRSSRIERIPAETFRFPEDEAIRGLPTVYRRREAERVVHSLDYAQRKIDREKGLLRDDDFAGTSPARPTAAQVLDLYRVTPKVQRPDTPELELEGDADEEVEDAAILLQRLIRGRAVQNDFFEGKERCQGLIKELQAASYAKRAEELNMASSQAIAAEASRQEEVAIQVVLDTAMGDIMRDTLGYLYQELQRQQDAERLEQLHIEAVAAREQREAAELARREAACVERECGEVQYKTLVRTTRTTAATFLEELCHKAVGETALQVAVDREREREAALLPRDPTDGVEKENLVCDMLDNFLVPVVLDRIERRGQEHEKKAPATVAEEIHNRQFALLENAEVNECENKGEAK